MPRRSRRIEATDALQELAGAITTRRSGIVPWFEKLSADDAPAFREIKRAFRNGDLQQPKSAVARGIAVMLENRGHTVRAEAIIRWLDKA